MTQPLGRSAASVRAALLGKIQRGDLAVGDQLPAERAIAQQYGVARNTIRAALARLEGEGILARQVGRGTYVASDGGARGIARGGRGAGLGQRMREASPADLMEVRLIIEPQAAALAAARARAEDLDLLQDALRNSLSARGLAEFEYWDARLHLAVFEVARNTVLIDYCAAINAVRDEPAWYQLKKRTVTQDRRAEYDSQHSTLVAAIADHDGARAEAAMRTHLLSVRKALLGA